MQLVIIEPHHHFDLILALQPSIFNTSYPILIVCSTQCKEEVTRANPAFEDKVRWNTEGQPKCPETPSVLFFTSLQYHRRRWLAWLQTWPAAVMIHNANLYARALPTLSRTESQYSLWRFIVEKHFRSWFRKHLNKQIIQYTDTFISFSSVQMGFMSENIAKPIHSLSVVWKHEGNTSGGYDFIPIYGRMGDVDWGFFHDIKNDFSGQMVCLCQREEHQACKKVFPSHTKYIFTPLPHNDYIKWFQNARRVIIPLKKQLNFGLSREVLGTTKYLWRIYWALQFDNALLMPDDIARPEIPGSPTVQIREFELIVDFLQAQMQVKS